MEIKLIISWCLITLIFSFPIYLFTKYDSFQIPFKPGEKQDFFVPFDKKKGDHKNELICKGYEDWIMDKSVTKLGDVFHTNIQIMHQKISIIIGILILIIVIYIIGMFLHDCFPSIPCLNNILFLSFLFTNGARILNFVFFIQLLYYYIFGDIDKYKNFLRCPNVNYREFAYYGHFTVFEIIFKIFAWLFAINDIVLFANIVK